MTEVWIRNPQYCVKECIEIGVFNFAWDRGFLAKYRVDASRFADLYIPSGTNYRTLVIGDQGTAELTPGHTIQNPAAVYPTWEYGEDDADDLEELIANNVADKPEFTNPKRHRAIDTIPVAGQEHRVVVIRPPVMNTGLGRQFMRLVAGLQEDHPQTIVHVHGLYGWRGMFANGLGSVDVEPRLTAKKGKVILPSGKELTYEEAAKLPQWVELVGYHVAELSEPRVRCMFNIKSALWAAEHFNEDIKFKVRGGTPPDPNSPFTPPPQTTISVKSQPIVGTVGDKVICDVCSLQNTCKYYRAGAVCSLPDSEPSALAKYFKTRNADTIIDGLGTLLAKQTQRLESGLNDEAMDGELNPEVTKIVNSLFTNGVKLAKLLNPNLGPKQPGVNVLINGNAAISEGNPQEMLATAVRALEAKGVNRADMTSEMIMGYLLDPHAPIEARAALTSG